MNKGSHRPVLRRIALALGIVALGAIAPRAHADSVLLTDSFLVIGKQSVSSAVAVSGPGTLTVRVVDLGLAEIPILQRLTSLSFSVSSGSSVLSAAPEPGEVHTNVTQAGWYYAHFSAVAGGQFQIGLLSVQISFRPEAQGPGEVPLPASVWLLLSGLVALGKAAFRARPQRRSLAPTPA